MSILIKNGRVIDPASKIDGQYDILVEDGRISKIAKDIKEKTANVIDAKDKIVSPGLIDIHVHLREPGREDKETILTGTRAAVHGGFTSIACMPNTTPSCDNAGTVKFIIDKARKVHMANVYPIGTLTKGRLGKELAEMADLKESGCVAVSDDGDSVPDPSVMRRVLEYASALDLPVICHCEDISLSKEGVMNEGFVSTILGLRGIPNKAESVVIQRDIELAEISDARIHIAHISTREGVDLVRTAKKKDIKVTAEVTPHHLALNDQCVKTFDTNTKVNPPLRTADDVKALKAGLKDGTIDIISSDHAPHLDSEKDVEYKYAPFGMIGLETSLAVSIMELIDTKVLTWPQLIEKMALNPSNLLGLKRGTLEVDNAADITIIDPKAEWTYTKDMVMSKSINTPFLNWNFKGRAVTVISGGKIVMRDNKL